MRVATISPKADRPALPAGIERLGQQEAKPMSSNMKLCWLSLGAAFVAASLIAGACGGDEEESSESPEAKAEATATGDRDTTGVTDTEVKLGIHIPLSQNAAAAYAPVAYGMKAFFDYINDQGGVYGQEISLLISDATTTLLTLWRL
jgi:ABC-type branched-subunit amino acid transport system substrate-binding protein